MSTEIKTIKGSCHYHPRKGSFDIEYKDAEIFLTRFFNGKNRGTNIQLTISNDVYGTNYIHLTKEQCEELAKVLNECFDYDKFPSE